MCGGPARLGRVSAPRFLPFLDQIVANDRVGELLGGKCRNRRLRVFLGSVAGESPISSGWTRHVIPRCRSALVGRASNVPAPRVHMHPPAPPDSLGTTSFRNEKYFLRVDFALFRGGGRLVGVSGEKAGVISGPVPFRGLVRHSYRPRSRAGVLRRAFFLPSVTGWLKNGPISYRGEGWARDLAPQTCPDHQRPAYIAVSDPLHPASNL